MACPSNPDQPGQRKRWAVGALTLCLALALAGCGAAAGGSKVTSAPTPTWRAATGAPGVSSAEAPGWLSYHDLRYGFVAQFPSDAIMSAPSGQSATSVMSWRFANPQDSADRATLEVSVTSQASASICSHYASGKPVTLAGGVTGYEQDNLSETTAQPQLAVVVAHDGLLSIITLTGQAPANTFMQRWGAVWSHILSAFQPGQGPAGANPCG